MKGVALTSVYPAGSLKSTVTLSALPGLRFLILTEKLIRELTAGLAGTESNPASRSAGLCAVTVTVTGALNKTPSLTISCATYTPCRSATNVGLTVAAFDSAATLPDGTDSSDHEYVNAVPSGSNEALP